MSDPVTPRMTLDEFLTWQKGQEDLYEFVDGQPVGMAGAQVRHDRVTINAIVEIRRHRDAESVWWSKRLADAQAVIDMPRLGLVTSLHSLYERVRLEPLRAYRVMD